VVELDDLGRERVQSPEDDAECEYDNDEYLEGIPMAEQEEEHDLEHESATKADDAQTREHHHVDGSASEEEALGAYIQSIHMFTDSVDSGHIEELELRQ
jgi:hypothetical protein